MTQNAVYIVLIFHILLIKENYKEKNYIEIIDIIEKNKKNKDFYKKYIIKDNVKKIFNKSIWENFYNLDYYFKDINSQHYKKLKKIIKTTNFNNSINMFLVNTIKNKRSFYTNETDEKEFLVINSILILENLNFNKLNIMNYNYFEDKEVDTIFRPYIEESFMFYLGVNPISLIWRMIFFIRNKKYMNNNKKIYVLTSYDYEYKYKEEMNDEIYIIHYGNLIDYEVYKKIELIVKLENCKYLIKKREKNNKNKEPKFIDLSQLNEKEKLELNTNLSRKIFYKNILKTKEIKVRKNEYVEYDQENHREIEIESEVIFLTDIFNEKDNIIKDFYRNLLNLEYKKYSRHNFEEEILKIEENKNLENILLELDFFKLIRNSHESELIYNDFYFPNKDFDYEDYEKVKQNLIIVIKEYSGEEYSSELIKDFINLFFIYSLYKEINIYDFYYNANIIKEIKLYIDNLKEVNEIFKEKKEINNKDIKIIKKYSLKNLFNYIENENKLIKDFYNTLSDNYKKSYNSVLNSYGYDRINKLFMFLEGYTSYISSFFVEQELLLESMSFENFKNENSKKFNTTFGTWDKIIEKTDKNKFIELTSLSINKIIKLKEIINIFRNLRNEIKGHGCYYNINENKFSELEEFFFDNIELLKEVNLEIKKIPSKNIKHKMFYESEDIILTFKNFYKEKGFNKIDFYNYSNPNKKNREEVNIGCYLYYLNIMDISEYFLNDLTKYYKEKLNDIRGYCHLNINHKFKIESKKQKYSNDSILFEVDIKNVNNINEKEFFIQLEKEKITSYKNNNKLYLNYKFNEKFSIFDEKNEEKILLKIEKIVKIIEFYLN